MMADGDTDCSATKLGATQKLCLALQSEDKKLRKQAFVDFQKNLSEPEKFTQEDYHGIFKEAHIYIFNGLRDKAEHVRNQTIRFINFFLIEILPVNDFYLSYLMPVVVERLASCEIIEESEEVRLQLNILLSDIIKKYNNTDQLKPFLNDFVAIYKQTVLDQFPSVKENTCISISALSKALPRDFHMQAENLYKPVLTAFSHQRYKIRVVAIECMRDIVMHTTYKALEEALGPMAERLFDSVPLVRRTVIQVTAKWLLEYRDRYSFFHKLLPLILTGINDEVDETREESIKLWTLIGAQYEEENKDDFKDKLDFLIETPKYYPKVSRPNLGCRELVRRNVSRIAPAVARELISWQNDVRLRCSQLLCTLALHAEEGATQHLQEMLPAMYTACRDDEDGRVIENIIIASQYLGNFVQVSTWIKLIIPCIESGVHFGHLTVLSGLINGTPAEYIAPYLDELTDALIDDSICQSRQMKMQRQLIKCVQAISDKYSKKTQTTGYNLFEIIISVVSLRDVDNAYIDLELLIELCRVLKNNENPVELWKDYIEKLLNKVGVKDPKSWTVVTAERCIFDTILMHSGETFGENLSKIGDILIETLDIECDPEARLKTFVALSEALENKDVIFKNAADSTKFLETIIAEIFVPTLIWRAGRVAEAMRTMAASCLRIALQPGKCIKLFYDKSIFLPIFGRLLPLLLTLSEDRAYKSRYLALENIILLKEIAYENGLWNADELIKMYPEFLKRLDDPTDMVRQGAVKLLIPLLKDAPPEFKTCTYKAHHDLLIDTLMTHFDDMEYGNSDEILRVVKVLPPICSTKYCEEKILRHKPLLRNQNGCDEILTFLQNLPIH